MSREQMLSERDSSGGRHETTSAPTKIHVLDHGIARHAMTGLRDQQSSSQQVRYYSHQLLTLLMIEATRSLPTRSTSVEASYGLANGEILAKPTIFISLNRHGLGLSHQVGDMIPDILIGSISLDHSPEHRVEPRLHLAHAPALQEAKVLLYDPVVGSGLSAGIALNLLRRSGAADLTLISFVVSSVGLPRIFTAAPEASVYCGAIDTEYDPKRGPLPGIGHYSQRLYQNQR